MRKKTAKKPCPHGIGADLVERGGCAPCFVFKKSEPSPLPFEKWEARDQGISISGMYLRLPPELSQEEIAQIVRDHNNRHAFEAMREALTVHREAWKNGMAAAFLEAHEEQCVFCKALALADKLEKPWK